MKKLKLAIALGGGGAKGYAHLGVLKAFGELDIDFDIVTGTSIGSLVGAVYAGGGIEKLEKISGKITLAELPKILVPAFSKQGLLTGNYIKKLLKQVIEEENIEKLSKKFASVCVDINKGDTVIFTEGSIEKAIRASIAIPGLFTPVVDGKKFLVDGGVLEPVPITAAKNLGADMVFAVDLISNYMDFSKEPGTRGVIEDIPFKAELDLFGDYIKSIGESLYLFEKNKKIYQDKTVIDIVQRISIITQSRLIQNEIELNTPDVVITPDVSKIGILDFHKSRQGIKAGYEAAKQNFPKIKKALKVS